MPVSGSARRSITLAVAVALSFTGCDAPTAPARVSLTVAVVRAEATETTVPIGFSLLNTGSEPIYIPACGGIVRPEVDVIGPGTVRDRVSWGCIAILDMGPVVVGPGDSYEGAVIIPRRPGARFRPFVSYRLARDQGPNRTVAAAEFESP
jgi:hypothetical protein